jgi:flagellar protein FliO/FliZ
MGATSASPSVFGSLMWLLLVLGGSLRQAQSGARVVGVQALSPTQKVVTLEVGTGAGRTWLVVGVTPQHMTVLHTLSAGDVPEGGQGSSPGATP